MSARMAEPPQAKRRAAAAKPDFASIGGLALAAGGILGGLLLEGGRIRDVAQITAAVIVFGGTLGAIMVSTPIEVLMRSARKLNLVFFDTAPAANDALDEIIRLAAKARKHGIVSLEQEAETIPDDFLRKALNLAVDGTDLNAIRNMMELEINMEEHHGEAEAKVFEAAG